MTIKTCPYDAYHKRVYGFPSEQMILISIMKNGLSYYEVPVDADRYLKKRPDLLADNADTEGTLKKLLQDLR